MIKVFVHLAYGFDAKNWQRDWIAGKKIGLNESSPYGYHHAETMGVDLEYSYDRPENLVQKFWRYLLRFLLGFDLVHAWSNRAGILAADVVWTHTESQSFSVLLLKWLNRSAPHPRIIAQCIWLFDEWPKLSPLRRLLYRKLLRRADILSLLSPLNAERAGALFPGQRVEMIKFGIGDHSIPVIRREPNPDRIHILSLGNDRHRDWKILLGAARISADIELKLATGSLNKRYSSDNVSIIRPRTNAELIALYEWADIVMLPLKSNLHASGITVIQEATTLGLPVICSRAGGLEAYFEHGEVFYIEPENTTQALGAIREVAENAMLRASLVKRARRRMKISSMNSRHFVRRHVELSQELMGRPRQEMPRPLKHTTDAD